MTNIREAKSGFALDRHPLPYRAAWELFQLTDTDSEMAHQRVGRSCQEVRTFPSGRLYGFSMEWWSLFISRDSGGKSSSSNKGQQGVAVSQAGVPVMKTVHRR